MTAEHPTICFDVLRDLQGRVLPRISSLTSDVLYGPQKLDVKETDRRAVDLLPRAVFNLILFGGWPEIGVPVRDASRDVRRVTRPRLRHHV